MQVRSSSAREPAHRANGNGSSHPLSEDRQAAEIVLDRPIGSLLRQAHKLSEPQVEQVLAYQRSEGLRFGEAAVALGLVSNDDVVWALSQQFHYAYVSRASHVNPELVAAASPFSDESEAFRELRSQLLLGVLSADQPRRALAVASPNIGDGKTYLAANMAVAFSQLGGRTLLIDADMRTPRQQDVFGLDHANAGLSGILSGRAEKSVVQRVPDLPSLFVLPVGAIPPNPLELVQRPAFELLVHEMLLKFDHVVVDTPAAVHGADARVIAAKCGAVLVMGRKGRSRMKAMNSLLAGLAKGPAKMAGMVLNEF